MLRRLRFSLGGRHDPVNLKGLEYYSNLASPLPTYRNLKRIAHPFSFHS